MFEALERARGKTIDDFFVSTRAGNFECHRGEELKIYFTDGSTLLIQTGSNVYNLILDHKNTTPATSKASNWLKSSDLDVHLFAEFETPERDTDK
jgi:hypothetical protein